MRRNIYTKSVLAARIVSLLDLSIGMKIADLGCGDGVFLKEIVINLLRSNPSPSLNRVASSVLGVDIEKGSVTRAYNALHAKYGSPTPDWNVICTNALTLDETHKFDAITGNPPWMRIHHMDSATKELAREEFAVAKGSYDLYHLFIEKSVRLLKSNGRLAIIVPQTLEYGPASAATRELLNQEGNWKLSPLSANEFKPQALIKPALLTFHKLRSSNSSPDHSSVPTPTLDSIAIITTGVPTGSDSVFIVNKRTVQDWKLEEHRLKPVVRGRDVRTINKSRTSDFKIVWPYSLNQSGKWKLDDLTDSPNILKYLEHYKSHLSDRPRLADFIKRNPSHWYRFIDPNRHYPARTLKVVIPDVFGRPNFTIVDNSDVVIHNTCFQIIPRPGSEETLLDAIQNVNFWEVLRSTSRPLENNFHRTSVSELKELSLNS